MIGKKEILCEGCGKIHEVDDLTHFAESYADELFPEIWEQGKSDLKSMSKKEVAEQMYFLGVKHFMEEVHFTLNKINEKIKK